MSATSPKITRVEDYLINGCMRCTYGGTPQCKVQNWVDELIALRQIVLETGLTEEIKWGVPVYTLNGKNIVSVNALKESANLSFFKGVLLSDPHTVLEQQGNVQSGRIIRFTNREGIQNIRDILKSYILEAIAIEESGMKVERKQQPEPVPDELQQAFDDDPLLAKAFWDLTPGRQRGYIIHFSQPKQSKTRVARIEKYKAQILRGIGLHDHYGGR